MQLSSLKIFVKVLHLGSFAAAARHLDLDPSLVSRAISRLESELGFRLFQRNTRKLAPTEAGLQYYAQVKGPTEELERAGQAALDLTSEPQGTIRVTACTSMGQRVIAPLLPRLMEAYPSLSIDLLLSDDQVDLIGEQIDLAIRFGDQPDTGVVATKLAPRSFRVCASPAYIQRHGGLLHPSELSERECLRFPFSGYRSQWQFRDEGGTVSTVAVDGRLMISHGLTMTQCTVLGLGPALLPDWLCVEELADGALVDLFPKYEFAASGFDTAAWMIHPSRSYVPKKVQAFMQFLQQEVGSGAHLMDGD